MRRASGSARLRRASGWSRCCGTCAIRTSARPPERHCKARRGAHAALDRLEQKLNGHVPAEELAQELADDLRQIQEQAAPARPQPDEENAERAAAQARALAGAVRNLAAPDAPAEKEAAIRLADQAADELAKKDEDARPSAAAAAGEAARAVQALADKLTNRPRALESALGAVAAGTTRIAHSETKPRELSRNCWSSLSMPTARRS